MDKKDLTHSTAQRVLNQDSGRSVAHIVSPRARAVVAGPAHGPVIQRKTIDKHLEDIVAQSDTEKRWDADYQEDFDGIAEIVNSLLRRVAADPALTGKTRPEFFTLLQLGIVSDDGKFKTATDEKKWDEYIVALQGVNLISKSEFDVYLYCRGFKKDKPGRGGLQSLAFEKGKDGKDVITGRPAFATETTEMLKTPAKAHRRHIIAWHNIRAFANVAYGQLGAGVNDIIGPLLKKLEKLSIYYQTKTKVDQFKDLDETKKNLLIAVFIMNSNPENLWVGPGKENSEINIASNTILGVLNNCKVFGDVLKGIDGWKDKDSNATVTAIMKKQTYDFALTLLKGHFKQGLGNLMNTSRPAFVNKELLALYYPYIEAKEDDRKKFWESELGNLIGSIKEWIISHLEFDLGFTEKDSGVALKKGSVPVTELFYKMLFTGAALDKKDISTMFTTLLTLPDGFKEHKEEEKT